MSLNATVTSNLGRYLERFPTVVDPAGANDITAAEAFVCLCAATQFALEPQVFSKLAKGSSYPYWRELAALEAQGLRALIKDLADIDQSRPSPYLLEIWHMPLAVHLIGFDSKEFSEFWPAHVLSHDCDRFALETGLQRNQIEKRLNSDRQTRFRFLDWLVRKNVDHVNRLFSPKGAEDAIEHFRTHFLPWSARYETFIDRVGAPAIRFEIEQLSCSPSVHHAYQSAASNRCFNILVVAQPDSQSNKDGGYSQWALFRRGEGGAEIPAGTAVVVSDTLGYHRPDDANARFDWETGAALAHEIGHCLQLRHLAAGDFFNPWLGMASDTQSGGRIRQKASVRSWHHDFPENLHADNMFMNIMSIDTELNERFFFTRSQSLRARTIAGLCFADWITHRTPAPELPQLPAPSLSSMNVSADAFVFPLATLVPD